MNGIDIAVRASRPRGISDGLAVNLAMQITRNESLETRCARQAEEIRRLNEAAKGYEQANLELFRAMTQFKQDLTITRFERDAAERKLAER